MKALLPAVFASLLVGCNPIPPKPVFSDNVDDPSLREGVGGYLAYETIDGFFVLDLNGGKPIPQKRVYQLSMASHPSKDGIVLGVSNDMDAKQHTFVTFHAGKMTELETREGDALWGIDFTVHPVGEFAALSQDGTLAAYVVNTEGYQTGIGQLKRGSLEIRDLKQGTTRIVAKNVMDTRLAFASGTKAVLCLTGETEGETPKVARIDLPTGKVETFAEGFDVLESPDPDRIVVQTGHQAYQWYRLDTREFVGEPIQKWVVGALSDGKLLIRDDPSPGVKVRFEMHGKGPRNTTSIKVYDPKTGKVATVANYLNTHAKVVFKPQSGTQP